jgi:queuine tRNA-ribosyltransferase
MSFAFSIGATDGRARAGRLTTPHGVVDTPAFMPVGTAAAVKAVTRGTWKRRERRSSSPTRTT